MVIFSIYNGPHALDLTSLQGKLIDIEAGGMRGLRTDMEGFPLVVHELAQSVPVAGAAAGVPQDVYEHFVMCNETVQALDERLAIARKQVEVLEESRAYYVDARQNDISLMVDAMRSRAQRRKDTSVLIPFEATLRYSSQNADKAVRTRRQNAQAQAEAEAAPPATSPAAPPATSPSPAPTSPPAASPAAPPASSSPA
ncbi:MAG: hypothetical protein IT372_19415 [Polyangiaceae bacterium]|nr:hypothetical protein [Polyangiaceae bacterium]